MKRPDPKACAQIAVNIHEFCTGKQPSYLLLDEELATVREALEFCAREPDGFVATQSKTTRRLYFDEVVPEVYPGDKLGWFACYRIETEGE